MLRSKKKVTEGDDKTPKKSKLLTVPKLKKKTGDKTPKTATTPTPDASVAASKSTGETTPTPVKKTEGKKTVAKKSVKKATETPERSSLSMPGMKSPAPSTAKKSSKTTKTAESPLKPTGRTMSETTKRKTPAPELSKTSKTGLERKSKDVTKATATKSTTPVSKTTKPKSTTPPPSGALAALSKEKKKKTKTGAETPKDKVIGVLKKIGSLGTRKTETSSKEKKEKKSKKGSLTPAARDSSTGATISPSPGSQTRTKSVSEGSSKTSPGAKKTTPKEESAASTLSPAPEVETQTQETSLDEGTAEPVVAEPIEPAAEAIEEKKESEHQEAPVEVEEVVEKPQEVVEKPEDEIKEAVEPTAIVEKPQEDDITVDVKEEEAEEKLPVIPPIEDAKKSDHDDEEPPEAAVSVPVVTETEVQPTVEIASVDRDADVVVHDRSLPSDLSPKLVVGDAEMPPEGMTGDEAMENLVSPLAETPDDVPLDVTRDEAAAVAVVQAPASTASSYSVAVGSEDMSVGGSLASTVEMHESGEEELGEYLDAPQQAAVSGEVRRVGPLSMSSLSSVSDLDVVPDDEDVESSKAIEEASEDRRIREPRREEIPGARELLDGEASSDDDDSSAGAELDTTHDSQSLGSFDLDSDVEVDEQPVEVPVEEASKPEPQPQPEMQPPSQPQPRQQPQIVTALPSREPIERVADDDQGYRASSPSSLSSFDPDDFIVEPESPEDMEVEPQKEPAAPVAPPVGLPPLGKLGGARSKSIEAESPSAVMAEPQPPKAVEPIPVQTRSIPEELKPVAMKAVPEEKPKEVAPEVERVPEPVPVKSDTSPIQQEPLKVIIPEPPSHPPISHKKPEASVRTPEKKATGPKGLPSLGLGLKASKKADAVTPVSAQLPKGPSVPQEKPGTSPPMKGPTWGKPTEPPEVTPKSTITVEGSNDSGSLAVASDEEFDDRVADLRDFGIESDVPDDNRTDEGRSPFISPAPTLDGYHSGGFLSGLSDDDFLDVVESPEVIPDVVAPPEVKAEEEDGIFKRSVSIDQVILPAVPQPIAAVPQTVTAAETSQQVNENMEEDRSKGKRGNTLISCAVYVLGGISGIAVTVLFLSQRGG